MDAGSVRSEQDARPGSLRVDNEKSIAATMSRSNRTAGTRSKRAKYTAAACDTCKRRKLKCIRESNERQCNRCIAGEVACSFAEGDDVFEHLPVALAPAPSIDNDSRLEKLEKELAALRRQVTHLTCLVEKGQTSRSETHPAENAFTPSQASVGAAGVKERKEVQFVGTTRPAFALNVAKAALSVVDESTDPSDDDDDDNDDDHDNSELESPMAVSTQSPEMLQNSTQDPLLRMPITAIYRLLDVFQDEIEPMYPVLDTANLRSQAVEMMKQFQEEYHLKFDGRLSQKNIHLLKIVLATALVFENQEKSELSSQLIASFEDDALRITSPSDVDLQETQVFAIMSVYHFHCDEELLAYRSIGIATRMVLELGLHRRRSLYDNYPDPALRSLAVRVFWCIYVLDRRWSFGTGLSFALIDRDIDPQLPQPSHEMPYFQSLVAYGKLCSKVWDAIPHYGSSSEAMLPSTEAMLESQIQGWFSTIPDVLQLTTADASSTTEAPRHDRSFFQHMQTLLYLRGNYIRCLIHRHHVVSSAAIAQSPVNARLVVSIAQDTIRILVNLNNTSDIYSRHQVAYNFFLISAISVMLLAVCHAPAEFAQNCRKDFFASIDLVRGFSRLSLQGRRLWNSLRGLVSRLRQLGILSGGSSHSRKRKARDSRIEFHEPVPSGGISTQSATQSAEFDMSSVAPETSPNFQTQPSGLGNFATTTPDMNLMGDDLVGVFDVFGRAYMENGVNPAIQTTGTQFDDNFSFLNGDADDFSEYFMGLI